LLWTRYIQADQKFISNYLRELMEVEDDKSEAFVLVKDILELSNRLNFQVLLPNTI